MFQFPGFASPTYVFSERYPIGVGCPIRISTDQSLLAAPHGFSQRATSFIASWCQGIHRMPFSYSITNASHPSSNQSPVPSRQPSPDHNPKQPTVKNACPRHHPHSAHTTNVPEHCRKTRWDDPWPHSRTTTIPSGQTNHPASRRTSPANPNQQNAGQSPPESSYAPRDAPEPDSQHKRTIMPQQATRPAAYGNARPPQRSRGQHIQRRSEDPSYEDKQAPGTTPASTGHRPNPPEHRHPPDTWWRLSDSNR